MNATIKDVAKAAKVSTATVSHVINKSRFVSDETKKRVQNAVKELDYHPSSIAQGLRCQETKIIGIIVPSIYSRICMRIVDGVERKLQRKGYKILVANSNNCAENEAGIIKAFISQRVDGILVVSSAGPHKKLSSVISASLPIAFIGRYPLDFPCDRIVLDSRKSIYDATKYLISKGHTNIGLVIGYPNMSETFEYYDGYQMAMLNHKLKYDETFVKPGDYTYEDGYKSTKELINKKKVTALFYADSSMAYGGLGFLQEKKLQIPGDVSIILGNDYKWATINTPPLTAIEKPAHELGIKAASLILEKIKNPKTNSDYLEMRMPTKFIYRKSVK